MQNDEISQTSNVQRRLPWLIAAGALLTYLLTLKPWITFGGLPNLARATGWDWHPMYVAPLHFLVTYPIRWLPTHWQIIALNLIAAVCSALTLALLARSVAILPHDRTRDQRALERSEHSVLSIRAAWLPPVLAALVCGLQLTFWENAVVNLGDSLDLLLFAYCARCLLEFRIAQRESWLTRMAVVYGAAMTNNFAMIAFFPAFLAALIWIRGRTFFNVRFILRMLAWGVAGLSFYLVLPAIYSASDRVEQSFWEILRVNWGFQKNTILDFPRYRVLLLSSTSLLPVLFIGIRWPAQFGDISALGNLLTNVLTHLVHAFFLVACLAVAFDPAFSPRKLGLSWSFLPFYYLSALTVGYCGGYFLLIFGSALAKPWQRPSALQLGLRKAIVVLVWLAVAGVPAGLIHKNFRQLQTGFGPYLSQFGKAAATNLPPEGAVVLSDDPYRLYSLKAALSQSGNSDKYVLVDTTSLPAPGYHRFLRRQYGDRWPKLPYEPSKLSEVIDSLTLIQLLSNLRRAGDVYYLHPSFGYYFEYFYLRPMNLVYTLESCLTNTVENPLLTAAEIRQNDEFWKRFKAEQLGPLIKAVNPSHAKELPNIYAVMVSAMYSHALNYLGVELQRTGDLDKAAEYFAAALELNTNNASAYVNLDYNQILRAGKRANPKPSTGAANRLGPYGGNWELLLGVNGPVDEPTLCHSIALTFARARNFRQAAQQLLRVALHNPENYDARVGLAEMYIQARLPDKALEEVAAIRIHPILSTNVAATPIQLIQIEAWAHELRRERETAERILRAAQKKYPLNSGPFSTLTQIYLERKQPTNAIAVLEGQIKLQTNNVGVLINLSALKMRASDPAAAIPYLNRALELSPQNPMALMNRAIAYLQIGNYDDAQRDYKSLLNLLPQPPYAVYYGLAVSAEKKNNTKEALKYYDEYLKLAPSGSPEIKQILERIKALKSGAH